MKTAPCFEQFHDSMKLFGAEQLSGYKLAVNDLVCRVRRLTVRSTDFVTYQEMYLNRCQLIFPYPNQISPPFTKWLLNLIHPNFTTCIHPYRYLLYPEHLYPPKFRDIFGALDIAKQRKPSNEVLLNGQKKTFGPHVPKFIWTICVPQIRDSGGWMGLSSPTPFHQLRR